jgi:hypothetical protein
MGTRMESFAADGDKAASSDAVPTRCTGTLPEPPAASGDGSAVPVANKPAPLGVTATVGSATVATVLLLTLTIQPPTTWTFEYFPNTRLEGVAVHGMLRAPDFEIRTDFSENPVRRATRLTEGQMLHSDFPRGLPEREGFSVRMRSCVETLASGIYRLAVKADDGVRLFVDDALVIDAWESGAPNDVETTLNLRAGLHLMTVEYINLTGPALLAVRMSNTEYYQRLLSLRNRTTRPGTDLKCDAD